MMPLLKYLYFVKYLLFIKTLLNYYFNSTINNYSKFKKLFINLKKSRLIEDNVYKNCLQELLNNENKLDYNNLNKKLDKIIEIYKIVQINLNKDFINNIKLDMVFEKKW